MSDHISYKPTDGLTYDPSDERYWDEQALDGEVLRAFEICHGCRMCFKYCDSFPLLFRLIDDHYDGDTTKITAADRERIFDACFQCKLCEVECPYTPRQEHEFALDFPKLVHRYQAVRRRGGGGRRLADRLLGDPDSAAGFARASLGIANLMNRFAPHRWLLEKVLGIHRKKLVPEFAPHTFEAWAKSQGLVTDEPGGDVVLFQTCFVQHNEPGTGRDVIEVLQRSNIDVRCVSGLVCCGMPAWEHGDLEALRQKARTNISRLLPYVDAGAKIIVINPTCSMMLRREYPELVAEGDRDGARRLADAVMDAGEYVWSIRDRLSADFVTTPAGKVAYHAPCHLRAQSVGFKGRDLLRKIPGVKPTMVMECCGHNGTYAMTTKGFEPSQRLGKKAFDGMRAAGAEVWASDCPLAAIQFQQHAGKKPLHPLTILARAYREDGFPTRVEKKDETGSP